MVMHRHVYAWHAQKQHMCNSYLLYTSNLQALGFSYLKKSQWDVSLWKFFPERGKSHCCLSSFENALLSKHWCFQIQTDQLFPYIELLSFNMLDNHRGLRVKQQLQTNTVVTWHLCGAVGLRVVESEGYTMAHWVHNISRGTKWDMGWHDSSS